ncbi:thylakoid lumenal 16.5 kDa protein, chloroplastic-like [Actinidia eriantha]|uniref:thylakoid lumenal 16.5 kDa protein, chloroplastic-like n=1 Tax=Actinidia eriantha TaxID=165200 RepID=UPI0025835054|nr:thylakoid lumenal 16.5 kDa protein, chloroplastic-like [Actinidia eriantha]
MATLFLSTAKAFLPILLSSPPPSSPTPLVLAHKHNPRPQLTQCMAVSDSPPPPYPPILTKRSLSLSLTSTFLLSIAGQLGHSAANAAILEADDDEELLERVKKDRKKRLERQGVISSFNKERAYLQDLVYQLRKVGQAIENNDLTAASSVLGQSIDTDWVQKANLAFTKFSSSSEEKTEIDTFNTSLASLISSVVQKDIEASKLAFVSSASAFEKWTALTGLVGQLKGL